MRVHFKKLPQETKKLIFLARQVSRQKQMPAYLVGGFVRDLILGLKNLDLDIVVEGEGIKFAEALAQKLKAKLTKHARFGTARIIIGKNSKIDLATARKEIYLQPAVLPQVSPGSLKDDLGRRDFSINCMAISISGKNFAQLIDPFCGRRDLKMKKIRVLHDLSFIDDPTRMLRAIRFSQRLHFSFDSHTHKLFQEAVRLRMLEQVQPQRLRRELILILNEGAPLAYIKSIQKMLGFVFLNAHLKLSARNYVFLESIQKEISWFEKKYPHRRQLDNWLIYFIGLLNSLAIKEAKSVCARFALRKGEEKRILSYKKISPSLLAQLSRAKTSPAKIFALLQPLSYEVIVLLKAKLNNRLLHKHIKDFFRIYNDTRLFISGDDLHRLGISPGPYYQKIFVQVLDAKLNGVIQTKQEELHLIKQLVLRKRNYY